MQKREWLLPNILAYFFLSLQQISALLIQIGLRKLKFSAPCLVLELSVVLFRIGKRAFVSQMIY